LWWKEKSRFMDAKITLSFRADVISSAKKYARQQGISLSRLVENMLSRVVREDATHFDRFPISDWVFQAAEGNPEYHSHIKSSKELRQETREARTKKK
jgi:hypothetical protein